MCWRVEANELDQDRLPYRPLAYEKAKVGERHAGLMRERADERSLVLERLPRRAEPVATFD